MIDSIHEAVINGSQLLFHHERILTLLRKRTDKTDDLRVHIATLAYEVEKERASLNESKRIIHETASMQSFMTVNNKPKVVKSKEAVAVNGKRKRGRKQKHAPDPASMDIIIQNQRQFALMSAIDEGEKRLVDMKIELKKLEQHEEESYYIMESTPYLNELSTYRQQYYTLTRDKTISTEDKETEILRLVACVQGLIDAFIAKFVVDDSFMKCSDMNAFSGFTTGVLLNNNTPFKAHSALSVHTPSNSIKYTASASTSAYNRDCNTSLKSREFTYKRLTHFRNMLKQAQGIPCKTVPDDLKQSLREECVKRRQPFISMTPQITRTMLRKLGFSTFYEETISITCDLNPKYVPLYIRPNHEEEFCFLFKVIEEPYEQIKHHVNTQRQNFMSYPFCGGKLAEYKAHVSESEEERLVWMSYVPNFDLLKGVERLIEHDKLWKFTCRVLRWPYFNTIGNSCMSVDYSSMNEQQIELEKKREYTKRHERVQFKSLPLRVMNADSNAISNQPTTTVSYAITRDVSVDDVNNDSEYGVHDSSLNLECDTVEFDDYDDNNIFDNDYVD